MSATGYLDACGFIPASSGTGDFVVSAAITGYQTPASAGAVNTTVYSYRAESADKSQWEEGFGAYTVSTTTLARTTVTANSAGTTAKISFSAAPNVQIVAASADLQNASLLASGTLPAGRLPLTSATLQASPSDPTRTTSTVAVMMGLGATCKITPVYSTRVKIEFLGSVTNLSSGVRTDVKIMWGTGTAPANGAASAGTQVGSTISDHPGAAGDLTPFANGGIVTGLTAGTPIWVDIAVSVAAGTGSVSTLSCNIMEF